MSKIQEKKVARYAMLTKQKKLDTFLLYDK